VLASKNLKSSLNKQIQKNTKLLFTFISCRKKTCFSTELKKRRNFFLFHSLAKLFQQSYFLLLALLFNFFLILPLAGNATEVLFHVTVMSLDTIDESSMVSLIKPIKAI